MTLVEVMVASLLASFGLATFLAAYTSAARVSTAADRRIRAMHSAREALEALRSLPYDHSYLAVGAHTLANATYRVTTTSGFVTTKDIELQVSWKDPKGGEPRQVVLWSSIASCMH